MQLGTQKNASTLHLSERWRNFEFWLAGMRKVVGFEQQDLEDVIIVRKYKQLFCVN
jgi:hypothetical protein